MPKRRVVSQPLLSNVKELPDVPNVEPLEEEEEEDLEQMHSNSSKSSSTSVHDSRHEIASQESNIRPPPPSYNNSYNSQYLHSKHSSTYSSNSIEYMLNYPSQKHQEPPQSPDSSYNSVNSLYYTPQEYHASYALDSIEYPKLETSQYRTKQQSDSKNTSYGTYKLHFRPTEYRSSFSDDNMDYLSHEFSNLEIAKSNEDSLFSNPLVDPGSSQEDLYLTISPEETKKQLSPVPEILPKVRKSNSKHKPKPPVFHNSLYSEKHTIIEQVKQRPFSYCLDSKHNYEDSRYPIAPPIKKVQDINKPRATKRNSTLTINTTNTNVNEQRRSVSDLQQYIKTSKEKFNNNRIVSFVREKSKEVTPPKQEMPKVEKKLSFARENTKESVVTSKKEKPRTEKTLPAPPTVPV
ncbi:uncharacterized protein SPAPADRAFT_57934, partial [Spathaspora passalidarum NRRL Y-27907]